MPLPLVTPGDLITSRYWNDLAAAVNNLEVRLAELEKGGKGVLRITQVLPPGDVTAGETIRISGSGFDYIRGAHSVFFGSTRATDFASDSSDSLLIVKVPDQVNGATPTGAAITMTVGNLTEFVTWPLTIKSRPIQIGGSLEFGFVNSTPTTPTAGAAITYNFRLASLSNADLSVLITPDLQFSGAPANLVEIHDANGELRPDRRISLTAGAEKTIGVKITSIPNVANGTTFNLVVTASAAGLQAVPGMVPTQTVGQAGEQPDSTITNLTFNSVLDGTASFAPAAAGDAVDGILSIPGASAVRVTIDLDTTFAGIAVGTTFHYIPSAAIISGTGWAASRNLLATPAKYTVAGPGAQEFPAFDIDAPASGQALIRFTLTREEAATSNKRSVTYRIQRT